MRNKFSELYWALFLSSLLAALVTYKYVRNYIRDFFGELDIPLDPNPFRINWGSWLLLFVIILLILLGLAIFLWRQQLKSARSSFKRPS
jgi:hypothetical protein